MGRGRAKAKQTRVARDLKYRDVRTDLNQLQRELQKAPPGANGHSTEPSSAHDDDDEDDRYASYADDDEDEDDDFDGEDDGGAHRSHHRES
jgi:hypothetical protein